MTERNNVDTMMAGSRIVGGVFGFAFAGIGLTVLIFLWSAPFNEFGSPPVFFRIFGSFIALCFLVMGSTVFIGALLGKTLLNKTSLNSPSKPSIAPRATTNYTCPQCGANLTNQADVSPLGDTKCPFCQTWFNIHQSPTGA